MENEVIETQNATMRLREDDIIQSNIHPGSRATLENVKENIVAFERLADGRKLPLMGVVGVGASIDKDARDHAKHHNYSLGASAIVVRTRAHWIIGSLFTGLNRVPIPTKVFTSEKEAVVWLKGFL